MFVGSQYKLAIYFSSENSSTEDCPTNSLIVEISSSTSLISSDVESVTSTSTSSVSVCSGTVASSDDSTFTISSCYIVISLESSCICAAKTGIFVDVIIIIIDNNIAKTLRLLIFTTSPNILLFSGFS